MAGVSTTDPQSSHPIDGAFLHIVFASELMGWLSIQDFI